MHFSFSQRTVLNTIFTNRMNFLTNPIDCWKLKEYNSFKNLLLTMRTGRISSNLRAAILPRQDLFHINVAAS